MVVWDGQLVVLVMDAGMMSRVGVSLPGWLPVCLASMCPPITRARVCGCGNASCLALPRLEG